MPDRMPDLTNELVHAEALARAGGAAAMEQVYRYPRASRVSHSATGPDLLLSTGSNEVAERYSFYGMRAILVIFMTQYLMGRGGEVFLGIAAGCGCVRS